MKTMLSGEPPLKSWPGLFDLYLNADGSFRAELGSKTAPRSLSLNWKVSPEEGGLAKALIFLSVGLPSLEFPDIPSPLQFVPFGGSNMVEMHHAAMRLKGVSEVITAAITKPLSAAFEKEVTILADINTPQAKRAKAKRTLLRRFQNALEGIEKKAEHRAHGNTAAVECLLVSGETQRMPLAWVAIQCARELVESTQRLPTKGEVQRVVEARFPNEAAGLAENTWRQVWKDAALDSLSKGEAWRLPPKKRTSKRTTTRKKTGQK